MSEDNKDIVEINIDVGKIDNRLAAIFAGVQQMGRSVDILSDIIVNAFNTRLQEMQKLTEIVTGYKADLSGTKETLSDDIGTLSDVLTILLVDVIGGLVNLYDSVNKIIEKLAEKSELDNADNIVSIVNDMDQLLKRNKGTLSPLSGNSKQKDSSGQLALPPGKESSSNDKTDTPVNGIVSGLVGDMGSLYSYDFSGLLEGLSSVKAKILENVTAWGQEVAAKAASKAEDIAIMAMYAADYVKAFGAMVAQLATSAGAWIAETAAKAANTAATWAQVAATTAWQAICTAATAVTTAFGAAMQFLTSPIGLVVLAIGAVIAIVALLIANWDTVSAKAKEVWDFVKTKFEEFNLFLQGVFAKDWTEQFGAFGNVLNAFFANVENIWNAVKSIFSGIVSFVKNIFAGDWSAAWDSIVSVFKGIWDYMLAVVKVPVNGIIGLINGLVEGVVGGINLVIKALNNISFDIPSWVPVIGGETFGFNLTTLTAPKIPLLAQGAVLPANRPFLAVVGDQRHGTNVEAPLTTIQEAVAVVLSQQLPALMAGFEAVVNEQRATREMIAQIQIGDDMIANAVHRFDRKMAVMRGG